MDDPKIITCDRLMVTTENIIVNSAMAGVQFLQPTGRLLVKVINPEPQPITSEFLAFIADQDSDLVFPSGFGHKVIPAKTLLVLEDAVVSDGKLTCSDVIEFVGENVLTKGDG